MCRCVLIVFTCCLFLFFFFFQAEDGIRDIGVTGVQTCALPISRKVAVITSVPASSPVGNDVLVTIPSGHGENTFQQKTSRRLTFTGQAGRNQDRKSVV